jgi:hypothetical protein
MVYVRQSIALQAVLDATLILTTVLACFAIEVQIAGGPTPASDALAVRAYGIALFFGNTTYFLEHCRLLKKALRI